MPLPRLLAAVLAVSTLTAAGQAPGPGPGGSRLHGRDWDAEVGTLGFERLLAANGMSRAGIASLRGHTLPASRADQRSAQCAVDKAARPLDIAALDAAMTRRDALAAAAADRHRRALIGWLRRLNASDGAILLQLVGTGERGGPPGGPGGPPPGRPGGPPPDGPPPGGPPPEAGRPACR